jgi:hypothetical protein
MDKKTLMIGDWVYNTHNKQNEQVQEIGSGLVMLNYNDLYEYDEIEPIPLTTEILEKNGFIKSEEDPILMGGIGCAIIYGGYKRLDEDKFLSYGDNMYPIRYVHQLQHALRLCGIKKQIEL